MRESAAELKGTVPWWRPDATVADQEERRGSAWMLRHRRSTRSSSSAVTGRCSGGLSPPPSTGSSTELSTHDKEIILPTSPSRASG